MGIFSHMAATLLTPGQRTVDLCEIFHLISVSETRSVPERLSVSVPVILLLPWGWITVVFVERSFFVFV